MFHGRHAPALSSSKIFAQPHFPKASPDRLKMGFCSFGTTSNAVAHSRAREGAYAPQERGRRAIFGIWDCIDQNERLHKSWAFFMGRAFIKRYLTRLNLLLIGTGVTAHMAVQAVTVQVIHHFPAIPAADSVLVQDGSGAFYGTTFAG